MPVKPPANAPDYKASFFRSDRLFSGGIASFSSVPLDPNLCLMSGMITTEGMNAISAMVADLSNEAPSQLLISNARHDTYAAPVTGVLIPYTLANIV